MRYLLSILTVLATLGAAEVQAQEAAPFARMGFGARGIGMSNALVADGFGQASPYYNPALAPSVARQSLSATASYLSMDRRLEFVQFAAPLRPLAGVAGGLIHAGVSNIDGRDASGRHTGSLSTDEYVFFLAFGINVSERVTIGTGLQVFYVDYFEGLNPTKSLALDLGVTYRATDQLRFGLTLDDLLAKYEWDTSDIYGQEGRTNVDRFPRRIRLGAAYRLMEGRTLLVAEYESRFTDRDERIRQVDTFLGTPAETYEVERLRLHDSRLRLGAEFQLVEQFTVRGGVDRLGSDISDGVASPSAGFSVAIPLGELQTQIDYALMLEPYAVGVMHFATLRLAL